jgi:hypothetical protein
MMFCWWEVNPNVKSERRAADFKRSESKEFCELVADIIWKALS